jgi:hypothetical protein
VPIQGHSTYLVELDETESAIVMDSILGAIASHAIRAAWMIEKGCQAQAEALLMVLQ